MKPSEIPEDPSVRMILTKKGGKDERIAAGILAFLIAAAGIAVAVVIAVSNETTPEREVFGILVETSCNPSNPVVYLDTGAWQPTLVHTDTENCEALRSYLGRELVLVLRGNDLVRWRTV